MPRGQLPVTVSRGLVAIHGKHLFGRLLLAVLAALIDAMNEKFGADVTDADKIWVEQQKAVVLDNAHLGDVARNIDRSAYEIVLEQRIADLLLERHADNGQLLDMFFEKPGFKDLVISYLADETCSKFRVPAPAKSAGR